MDDYKEEHQLIQIQHRVLKGIVKWDFFFSQKVGQLHLDERAKKNFGLGPFLGLS